MRPYSVVGDVEIYHADALDLLRSLPDASVQLIATDPPYFRVKDEAWDRAWTGERAFLRWIGHLCREWRRVLAPNGSLYVFASPDMALGVERIVRRHFNVLNSIRWEKEQGWHQKAEKEALRSFLSPWEACVFAEHITGDTFAADASGYYTATTQLRRRVYAPIGDYFRKAREGAGLSRSDTEVALGYVSRTDPTRGTALYTRWEEGSALPTREAYERLQELVGGANAPLPYIDLRRWFDVDCWQEYEGLRQEYEGLRRPFNADASAPSSDLWRFPTVSPYPGKHPCEKPLAMMEHIIRTSSRPGDLVLDTFCGSGATAEAARNLGRRAIVGDFDAHWCGWTARRLSQESLFSAFERGAA